jgi:hypothetical protein
MSRRVGPTCHASQGVINIIGTLWWWIGKQDPDLCNPLKYSRYYLYMLQHSRDRNLPAAFIYTHRIFLKLNNYHFSLHVANRLIFVIEEKRGFLWGMNWLHSIWISGLKLLHYDRMLLMQPSCKHKTSVHVLQNCSTSFHRTAHFPKPPKLIRCHSRTCFNATFITRINSRASKNLVVTIFPTSAHHLPSIGLYLL